MQELSVPHPHHTLDVAAIFPESLAQHNNTSTADHHLKYVGHSENAVIPTNNIPVATVKDVPSFYNRMDPEGAITQPVPQEMDALNEAFQLKRGPAGANDASKQIRRQQFGKITKDVFKIPVWLKDLLYRRIASASGASETQPITYANIKKFYDSSFGRLTPNRRLFELIRQNPRSSYLSIDDLKFSIKFLVENHPGLEFLKQPEFQECYCRTVAIRIMFGLEVRQSRKLMWPQFNRSDLPQLMRDLDDIQDINTVLSYFSYEHFYVLYCRFWELDTDRDQLVGYQELQGYSQGAIVPSVLQRVVQGAGRKLSSGVQGKLDFEDFVYFCLCEEDKNTPQAVYYWFKVLDTDCDGILSGYELGKFFQQNESRFVETCGDELKYADMMCQMVDMIGANKIKEHPFGLTLADLRSCETPANFFNMIFNASKFLNFEHRDPFFEHQQKLQPEKTDWDRFARLEYDRMANEVGQ
jgi:Ca2+-binding EF-hand superfamily protein